MFLSIEVLPARKGDCLLLHFGKAAPTRLVVVDGGPAGVYEPHLKPRLAALRTARGLAAAGKPLPVEALLVSHIDDDHIRGVLDLTKALRAAKQERRPVPFRVNRLWHNGLERLLGSKPGQWDQHVSFGAAALVGEADMPDTVGETAAMVLASVPQGRQLDDDARFLGWPVNPEFEDGLIQAAAGLEPVSLAGGLRLTVVGPLKAELKALRKQHEDWARAHPKDPKPAEALAAYLDKSVTNLSSVVLLVEFGGRRALLTGDARGDKILEGLELTGLLPADGTLHLDLLKVPHHGSSRNMEMGFFRRVTADHYVFSGDGEHGNPERETVEMLLAARGKRVAFTLHFTYPIEIIDQGRRADWEKEQAKEQARRAKSGNTPVRPDWDAKRMSLATLFAARGLPGGAQDIRIVEAGKPHLIHLIDAVPW